MKFKMTIDEIIQELEHTKDYPVSEPASDEVLDGAINILHKYQRVQDKLDQLENEMEIVLESDTRTMINRESENGWLFDKILKWKKALEEIEEGVENGNKSSRN